MGYVHAVVKDKSKYANGLVEKEKNLSSSVRSRPKKNLPIRPIYQPPMSFLHHSNQAFLQNQLQTASSKNITQSARLDRYVPLPDNKLNTNETLGQSLPSTAKCDNGFESGIELNQNEGGDQGKAGDLITNDMNYMSLSRDESSSSLDESASMCAKHTKRLDASVKLGEIIPTSILPSAIVVNTQFLIFITEVSDKVF